MAKRNFRAVELLDHVKEHVEDLFEWAQLARAHAVCGDNNEEALELVDSILTNLDFAKSYAEDARRALSR